MITEQEIIQAQEEWARGLIKIGSFKHDKEAYKQAAIQHINDLYAYDKGKVLFKPTKSRVRQFRTDARGALSYFVAGDEAYPEDLGFALQPWINIRFENAGIITDEKRAISMGNYYFTDAENQQVKVEYTFGFIKTESGKLKIDLHHSSLPFAN